MENLKNLLNTIWDAIWQNKIIRVQIWNVISAGITLVVAYLTNLQDKVSNEILVQILVLWTVIIQQGLKYLNTKYFDDVGVKKEVSDLSS